MGIDIKRKEAINQAYFPVIIRATQGHNASIAKNPDTDVAVASAYYSVLDKSEANSAAAREGVPIVCLEGVPKILYHRTSRDSFQSILQGGLVAGSQSSGRVHNYFATCPVSSESYRSGVRAYAPIEIKWDTEKLLRSGCLLFTTRSEGVLCREPCAPSAIISIIDTVKEEVLYSLRIDDAPEVPSGSAGSTLPSRKRQLPARESLSSTDAQMAEPDDEYVEVEVEQDETMDATEGKVPQPRTPPATRMTVEDAAANVPEPENPFVMTGPSIFPCPTCQAECFVGQHHCIRCRHRLADSKGEDRRFIQAAHHRNRILDRLATVGVSVHNISPYELQKLARHTKEEERGQMSYEAHTIRKAKDKVQRALKIKGTNFRNLADRFDNDPTFAARQAENGLTRADMRRLQVYATGFLPAPGRTRQQVILGAGSQADFHASRSEVNAKLVIYDGVAIEELKALGLADDDMTVNMGVGWHGTFMDVATFAGLALGNEDARKVLTFQGLVSLQATNLDALKTEIRDLILANYDPAQAKVRSDQPARARQSEISKAKSKAAPAAPRQRWTDADWERWQYGGYYGRNWYSAAEWRRYWGQRFHSVM